MLTFPAPNTLISFTHKWGKLGIALSLLCLFAGILWIFTQVPQDYQQGNSAKIMFVHVPTAWGSLGVYTLMAIMSISSLIFRQPLADVISRASAPIGLAICTICLITGAIWGRPMWGAWWVWDARLTSMLLLWFIYLALCILWNALDSAPSTSKIMAVATLIGFVNIPIIKFSVEWWNTLHQPAGIIRMSGSSLSPEFLWPLLFMAFSGALLTIWLIIYAVRNELLALRLNTQIRRKFTKAG